MCTFINTPLINLFPETGVAEDNVVIEESLADVPIEETLVSNGNEITGETVVDNTDISDDTAAEFPGRERVDWNDASVRLLLSEYEALLSKFRNPIVKKKLLWLKVRDAFTENGYTMSSQQIENKWRVLMRNYAKAKSEGVTENCDGYPYFEETQRIVEAKVAVPDEDGLDHDESK